jgi:hypothetical protein
MRYVVGFARFWYDFIIGDDWTIAAMIAAALVVIGVLAHTVHVELWWLLPLVVIAALGLSLRRATRSQEA